MKTPMLQIMDLTAGYDRRTLYRGVNLETRAGELVALLGANGAGKSTLLRCITGRLTPQGGRIEIASQPLSALSASMRAKLIGVVTTDRQGGGGLTVEEMVALGRQPYTGYFGRLSAADREVIGEALRSVGMAEMARRRVASLSDGERQKVMIARGLSQAGALLVLDEPTAFLDAASRLEVMALLSQMAHSREMAVVMSTHDVASALRIADRLWLVKEGEGGERTVESGTPQELIANGALGELFRGRRVEFSPELLDFIPG